VVRTT